MNSSKVFLNFSPHRLLSSCFRNLPEHRALIIEKFGEPKDNVILKTSKPEEVLPEDLGPDQVLVEHLAACVNPADINLVQGVYGIRPKLPTVVGNEGITRVKSVGDSIKHLKPGDLAVGVCNSGYWQSYSVQNENSLYKVDNDLDVEVATQLKVNPCTAYRMIKDFCDLQPGDAMIQNGANSAVGVYAIQLAKYWGIKTINVIRDRPNKSVIIDELKEFGADYVITEEELRNIEIMTPILKDIGKPKLFLNCVSGKNAANCLRVVDHGGHCVTYGFMSKQPLTVGAQSMFKDHKLHFFWMSPWYVRREEQNKRNEIVDMLEEIVGLFKRKILRPKASTLISFEDRNIAFSGSNNTKYIFSINK